MRAGNVYVSSSGSIYRTDTAGAGGIHITTNAIYPGNSSGGIVNGSTSLGASNFRFNTLFSSGVDNSGTITTNDIVVSGNLTVTGTTSQSTQTSSVTSANNMTLLSTTTGSPTANASFEIERGSDTNAKILWNETDDKFVIDNTIDTGKLTAGSNTATALTVKDNGTNGGYFNVKSNVGGVATDGNVGLHVGWNKSNGGREVNMIFDGGTTQADTEMIFTSTDGSTYTDIFQINGGGNVDIKSGGLRIGTTTVIDSGRRFYPVNIQSGGTISFLNGSNGSSGSGAQGINVRHVYAGTTYASTTAGAGQIEASAGFKVAGNEVISSAGSGTFTSAAASYSSGQVALMVKDTSTGRGTIRIRSDNDNPAECFFDVNGAIRWDISARDSSGSYDLNFYSQGSTPSYTSVSGPALQLKQNGDLKVQTALYTGGTQRISSAGALTNVSGNISQFTNDSGYITSADGGNAGLLDGLDSADFLRRGSSYGTVINTPNSSNQVRFENGSGQSMNSASSNLSRLECFQATAGADAFMQFHVSGDYAFYFGIDGATNDLSVGGWSMGANKYRVYHAGNIGSQSLTIGTLGVTNDLTPSSGIQMRRDQSAGTGISWYTTSYTSWATYMAAPGATGCGASSNITAAASAHGVTNWALRNFIENASGYGFTWESGTATGQPTVIMGLNSNNGNLSVGGTVTANSDRRIKKNIVTIDNALDKVLKLRGVTFQRTDIDDDKTLMGVVAQEVEEVIPEVVSLGDADDPDSIKSVSYGNMVGVLIEAIKEQQKQIDELKKQIESK